MASIYTMDYNPADLFPQLGGSAWQGYVDELRLTAGLSRYVSSSFALQTQAHQDAREAPAFRPGR